MPPVSPTLMMICALSPRRPEERSVSTMRPASIAVTSARCLPTRSPTLTSRRAPVPHRTTARPAVLRMSVKAPTSPSGATVACRGAPSEGDTFVLGWAAALTAIDNTTTAIDRSDMTGSSLHRLQRGVVDLCGIPFGDLRLERAQLLVDDVLADLVADRVEGTDLRRFDFLHLDDVKSEGRLDDRADLADFEGEEHLVEGLDHDATPHPAEIASAIAGRVDVSFGGESREVGAALQAAGDRHRLRVRPDDDVPRVHPSGNLVLVGVLLVVGVQVQLGGVDARLVVCNQRRCE